MSSAARSRLKLAHLSLLFCVACVEANDAAAHGDEESASARDEDAAVVTACLFAEAKAVVRQAREMAVGARCETDADCVLISDLPSCYAGCPLGMTKAAEASFAAYVDEKLDCSAHDPSKCGASATPECEETRALCIGDRCQPVAIASIPSNGCPYGCPHRITADFCAQLPLSPIADYDTTLAAWQDAPHNAFLVEARCDAGQRLLFAGTGLSAERRYFDQDGKFLSLDSATDANPSGCPLSWPAASSCAKAEVTRVLLGTAYREGQVIPLK